MGLARPLAPLSTVPPAAPGPLLRLQCVMCADPEGFAAKVLQFLNANQREVSACRGGGGGCPVSAVHGSSGEAWDSRSSSAAGVVPPGGCLNSDDGHRRSHTACGRHLLQDKAERKALQAAATRLCPLAKKP